MCPLFAKLCKDSYFSNNFKIISFLSLPFSGFRYFSKDFIIFVHIHTLPMLENIISKVNEIVWNPALVGLLIVAGLYFSFRTRFVQVRLKGTA